MRYIIVLILLLTGCSGGMSAVAGEFTDNSPPPQIAPPAADPESHTSTELGDNVELSFFADIQLRATGPYWEWDWTAQLENSNSVAVRVGILVQCLDADDNQLGENTSGRDSRVYVVAADDTQLIGGSLVLANEDAQYLDSIVIQITDVNSINADGDA